MTKKQIIQMLESLPQSCVIDAVGKHALSIPDDKNAYEIGVIARRDGKPGYTLLWDFWAGGYGLVKKVGANCDKLKQAYAFEVAAKKARSMGYQVKREAQANGDVRLRCFK